MTPIIFTGGGTGGHVYPGLAVLAMLPASHRSRVVWIGSRGGVERQIVTAAGVPFVGVPAGKLRRYFDFQNVLDFFRVFAGIGASLKVLRRTKAAAVFSKGGFVAVPVVVAARLLGIPVVIHESDADPGLATRLTAPLAQTIMVPYPETAEAFPRRLRRRIAVTGNPVRPEFTQPNDPGDEFFPRLRAACIDSGGAVSTGPGSDGDVPAVTNVPILFVTGGSLGALQINRLVAETIAELTEAAVVVHQTGDYSREMIGEIASRARQGRYYGAPSFTDLFAPVLRRSALVVARAGAGTIWEIAVCGRPSLLVPLATGASRGDQLRNAERYRRCGAAVVLEDPGLDAPRFLREVMALLSAPDRREAMAASARRWAPPDAAERIANRIVAVAGTRASAVL
jgi:UDP-N-acetylglucosamine--N-acetylmuramyl-(pentapeptide) pyrophosphoryl-undecaprenol N-acetylglucosamine transferase